MRPLLIAVIVAIFGVALVPFFGPNGHGASGGLAVEQAPGRLAIRTTGLRVVPPVPLTSQNTVLSFAAPPIMARAAYLVDVESGKVLYQKKADERLPMASTTKITTAVVTLQHAHLSDMVKASKAAGTIGESTMELRAGERLSVRDLLYGLLLNSGNDAAVALAEHVGGTQAHFVAMMNAFARDLGMTNTHYATPHGLDAPHHYTSAKDLATISLYAMRDPNFRAIVRTTDYHIPKTKHNLEHYLGNINKALYWYPGVDGVKPGDTDSAGLCQVVTASRNGRRVLAVLLHTPNLATDLRNLLNFGTRDFQWVPSIYAYDQPSTIVSGTSSTGVWRYVYGSGHYVRGAFVHYFDTHGGLNTLGLPMTEQLQDAQGRTVQFFQNAELVADPLNHSAYPEPLGADTAGRVNPGALSRGTPKVSRAVAGLYRRLGGAGVLGRPVTKLFSDQGTPVQFFKYGELASVNGSASVVPLGIAALRINRWLPAEGVADWFAPTMSQVLAMRYQPPALPRPARRPASATTRHGRS